MVRNVIRALEPERPQSTPALEPLVDLGRTRLEMVLKVLDVDGAVRRVKGGWVGTGQPWEYDEPRYRKLDEARKREQQAMLDYQATDGCRMAFLRGQLDDPELGEGERCGRCDNCTGAALRRRRRRDGGRGHPPAADATRRGNHAAQAVAVRPGQARREAQRAASATGPRRAGSSAG